MNAILALILVLPLLGGLLTYGVRPVRITYFSILGIFPAFILTIIQAVQLSNGPLIMRWEWLPGFTMGWTVDALSAALMALVCLVSLLVHLFSAHYLHDDPALHRYYLKLGFFTTSMLGLLAADHLLLLFIFWELVGFSSYLLIGFWYRDSEKARSARQAFMINRVADAGLLMGIILMLVEFHQPFLSELTGIKSSVLLDMAGLGMLAGALGKSAQFPFFGWLPKAMAGPTPVSALIHAATMVAAGVYLLVRVYPVLSPMVLDVTATLGALTAFMAAVAALTQFDIKKVLAFSTISQLGYMIMGIGVGAYDAAVFHLWTHAFFKAGLFLASGAVIHYYHSLHHHDDFDPQDMRNMGGVRKVLPVTHIVFVICGLALSGLPFFSGFLSKEGILTGAWDWAIHHGASDATAAYAVVFLGFITALLTPFYAGRQLLLVFYGKPRTNIRFLPGMEPGIRVILPLVVLAMGAVWLAHALSPLDAHGWWLAPWIFESKKAGEHFHTDWGITVLSMVLVGAGLLLSYRIYKPGGDRSSKYLGAQIPGSWYGALSFHAWFVEAVYEVIGRGYGQLTRVVYAVDKKWIDPIIDELAVWSVVLSKVLAIIDREVIDGLVNLGAWVSKAIGRMLTGMQSGRVQSQLVWLVLFLIVLILGFSWNV